MGGLLRSSPFVQFICGRMWCPQIEGATRWVYVLRHSESSPLGLSVRKCGASGSASDQTACPVCPTLCQSQSRHSHASPLHPGALSPPLLLVWMNVYFLFPWCGLPCHSIFCQFWLCEEAQFVYLHLHLGSLDVYLSLNLQNI